MAAGIHHHPQALSESAWQACGATCARLDSQAIERLTIERTKGHVEVKPDHKVRVADEGLAECDEIGAPLRNGFFGATFVEAVIGHEDLVYDTVGGVTLDAAFQAVRRYGHVVSSLGWGTHALAPLSFRGATYSGVFTLLPLLTGEGRPHHGDILREATRLVEGRKVIPRLDPRRFTLESVGEAYTAIKEGSARGKLVVDVSGTA